MEVRPLLITGRGSADDRRVSMGARGRRSLTFSCQVSWSSYLRKFLLSPWKPAAHHIYNDKGGWGVTAKPSPSTRPPKGIKLTRLQCLTHRHTHIFDHAMASRNTQGLLQFTSKVHWIEDLRKRWVKLKRKIGKTENWNWKSSPNCRELQNRTHAAQDSCTH